MDNHKMLFSGHISSAKCRLRGARDRQYKPLVGLSQSEGQGSITYIAEVLEFDAPNTARVLQLWSHRGSGFAAGMDLIYIHEGT
jgi:hypothetical protein